RAIALASELMGDWQRDVGPTITRAVDAAPVTPIVRVVAKADAPQSELRIGHVGLPRRHPDYFDVTVMNAVLGGLFSSRTNPNQLRILVVGDPAVVATPLAEIHGAPVEVVTPEGVEVAA